jgi:hypothetical protein
MDVQALLNSPLVTHFLHHLGAGSTGQDSNSSGEGVDANWEEEIGKIRDALKQGPLGVRTIDATTVKRNLSALYSRRLEIAKRSPVQSYIVDTRSGLCITDKKIKPKEETFAEHLDGAFEDIDTLKATYVAPEAVDVADSGPKFQDAVVKYDESKDPRSGLTKSIEFHIDHLCRLYRTAADESDSSQLFCSAILDASEAVDTASDTNRLLVSVEGSFGRVPASLPAVDSTSSAFPPRAIMDR